MDRKVFIEIYADSRATLQSFLLVLLVAIATGIGVLEFEGIAITRLLFAGVISWTIEAALAFAIGRFILPMPGTGLTPPSVARAITFAQAPGLLMILGVMSGITPAVVAVSVAWQLATTTTAFKHAFAWSLPRATAGVVVGAPLYVLAMAGIISLLE